MAKYNYDFKKKIVQDYLAGKGGYVYLAKKYAVPADNNIKKWIIIIRHMETKDYFVLGKINLILLNINFVW